MLIFVVISGVTQTLLNVSCSLALGSGMRWAWCTRTLVVCIDVRVVKAPLAADDEARSAAKCWESE